MSLAALVRRDVATREGPLALWSRPEAFAGRRPVVVGLQGLLAGPDDLSRLPEVLARIADAAIVGFPGAAGPPLADPSLEAFARAVGEAVAGLFPGRPVVLLGASIAAVAALGVKAPNLRRIVAAEPPLVTDGLWPLVEPIRAHLRAHPQDVVAREAFWRLFGVDAERTAGRDYRAVLDGLAVPADVLLGAEPLDPPRPLERLPSLVAPAARARLAGHPQVRLHRAPGAGHNVQAQGAKLLREVLFEACRRASAEPAVDVTGLDEALLEAVPLSVRRVLHWGPAGRAFAGAYLSWNPTAAVTVLGEAESAGADESGFDAVVLGRPPAPGDLRRLAARLAPGGWLVARWAPAAEASPAVRQALAEAGLELGAPIDPGGSGVLRARRADGRLAPPPLRVEMVAFASYLMDVRTRLPCRGLRGDPEVLVEYVTAPHHLPPAPADAPKVLVLQRPGPTPLEKVRGQMAHAMARGWLVVLEYDDHPGLVAEALGRPFAPDELARFGWVHAVQTTTDLLARLFGGQNPEVRIFENAVFELAPFPPVPRPARVFYGAVSRGGFGVEVARAVGPVAAEVPDAEFVVLGDRAVFEALPTARKRFEDYLPYEAYLARMAGCAVSLSPIEPHPLRETKSDAKFLDAARAGVVTIASPSIYDRVIEHEVNGLLAAELADWPRLLRRALAEPAWRHQMARRAWDYVRAERMFAPQAAARRDWYRDLWSRREALDAAVCARLPGLAEAVAAERRKLGR